MNTSTVIPFNVPYLSTNSLENVKVVLDGRHYSGDGPFSKKCSDLLEKQSEDCERALLVPSCTAALEMCALLLKLQSGDEIIMPSFTFVSTANAFALMGGTPVFVDINPETQCISVEAIRNAITERTKAVVVVHYAGAATDILKIKKMCEEKGLILIEDAAQAIGSTYCGMPLGYIGDLGTLSFHETKNINCGEGGALLINNQSFVEEAEIIREKGTDRNKFYRGQIDKYTWQSLGSSYLMNELTAAVLYAQLLELEAVTSERLRLFRLYNSILSEEYESLEVDLPKIQQGNRCNGHIFYIKLKNLAEREQLIKHLANTGISSVFHYQSLHETTVGKNLCRINGNMENTIASADTLLRLPMWVGLSDINIEQICASIKNFFNR